MAIITWVLYLLAKQTFKKFSSSVIILSFSFVIIWGIALWKVKNDYNSSSYMVEYVNNNGETETAKVVSYNEYNTGEKLSIIDNESVSIYDASEEINAGKAVKDNLLFDKENNKLGETFTR